MTEQELDDVSERTIFISCPYEDKDEDVVLGRVALCRNVCATFSLQNWFVVCPNILRYDIEQNDGIKESTYWRKLSLYLMRSCGQVWVIDIPGWETDPNVQEELAYANSLDIPIEHVKITYEREDTDENIQQS